VSFSALLEKENRFLNLVFCDKFFCAELPFSSWYQPVLGLILNYVAYSMAFSKFDAFCHTALTPSPLATLSQPWSKPFGLTPCSQPPPKMHDSLVRQK